MRSCPHHLARLGVSSALVQAALNGNRSVPWPSTNDHRHGPRGPTAYSRKRWPAWWKGWPAFAGIHDTGRRSLCRTASSTGKPESAQPQHALPFGCWPDFHLEHPRSSVLAVGMERFTARKPPVACVPGSAKHPWDSCSSSGRREMPRNCGLLAFIDFRHIVPSRPIALCPPFRTLDQRQPRRPQRQHRSRHPVKRDVACAWASMDRLCQVSTGVPFPSSTCLPTSWPVWAASREIRPTALHIETSHNEERGASPGSGPAPGPGQPLSGIQPLRPFRWRPSNEAVVQVACCGLLPGRPHLSYDPGAIPASGIGPTYDNRAGQGVPRGGGEQLGLTLHISGQHSPAVKLQPTRRGLLQGLARP